ncbi:MAG: RidA family protein [Candidatus Methanoplasma sp.]|jgi:2-iminobutanoate/2-iminopropanoate deaminase|nr:RidA family protein [Candidatus Methanoplasma sp.]
MAIAPISTDRAPKAIGPYSQGARAGGLVATSGQIPVNPETGLIPEGIEAQARQSLSNVLAVLSAAGVSHGDVVSVKVFLTDINDFAVVNKVYGEFFKEPYPARSCFQVGAIPKGAKIEVEALAYKG